MKKIIVWTLALALLLGVVSIAEEIRANGYHTAVGRILVWSRNAASDIGAWVDHTAHAAISAWNGLMHTPTAEAIGAWVSDAAETAIDAWNSFVHAPMPAEDALLAAD